MSTLCVIFSSYYELSTYWLSTSGFYQHFYSNRIQKYKICGLTETYQYESRRIKFKNDKTFGKLGKFTCESGGF